MDKIKELRDLLAQKPSWRWPQAAIDDAFNRKAGDYVRSILNSPDEAAGDGWLPIESAPKDGTRILGFWISLNGDHVPDVTRYSEGHWRGAMPEDDEENEFGPPDFWRPLPAPPAALGVAAPDGGRS